MWDVMGAARGALLAGGGLAAGDDIGVVAAHEVAPHLRLLLLQHLVQRPLACTCTPPLVSVCASDTVVSEDGACVVHNGGDLLMRITQASEQTTVPYLYITH